MLAFLFLGVLVLLVVVLDPFRFYHFLFWRVASKAPVGLPPALASGNRLEAGTLPATRPRPDCMLPSHS